MTDRQVCSQIITMEGVTCRLQVTEFLCYVQLDHTVTESGTQELVVDQNTLLGRLEPKN